MLSARLVVRHYVCHIHGWICDRQIDQERDVREKKTWPPVGLWSTQWCFGERTTNVLIQKRNRLKVYNSQWLIVSVFIVSKLNHDLCLQFHNKTWNGSFVLNLFNLFHFPSWLNADTSVCLYILPKICDHFNSLKKKRKIKNIDETTDHILMGTHQMWCQIRPGV